MARELGHDLQSHESVREEILDHVAPLGAEKVPLSDLGGRVLREPLVCSDLLPPFDASAMDGFAVAAATIAAASDDAPVTLPVVGRIAAGAEKVPAIDPSQAARIMTGAAVPPGADVVVPHELTRFSESEVTFTTSLPRGKNIRPRGADMRPGMTLLEAGELLTPARVAVAASLGAASLSVSRRPRVAILSPGKELVEPWETPGPGQIRNSNAYGLAAFVRAAGGIADVRGIVDDDPAAIRESIAAARREGADLFLSTGGISAGDFDHVRTVVSEDGHPGNVYKTDMRPGKPQVFGLLDGVPFLGLPGNPAAAVVSFVIFVRPVLRKLIARTPCVPEPFAVRFVEDHPYKGGRVFMLRARVEPDFDGGGYRVAGAGSQDSGFLAALAHSDALVRLPPDGERARAGELYPALWIDAT